MKCNITSKIELIIQHPEKKHYGGLKNVRIRDFNKSINQSYISTLKLVGSANFKVLFKLKTDAV
ncbi:hypothetical protein ACVPOS_06860 [Staphylococcus aureus]